MKTKAEIMVGRRGGPIPDLEYIAESGVKKCKICKEQKEIIAFVKSAKQLDGLESRCRDCNRKRIRAIREKTPGYNTEHTRKFRQNHPEKRAAHLAVARGLRAGLIVKQPCVVCGDIKSESHHEDYTKQLDVIWFCRKHHAAHHEHKRKELEAK